MFMGEFLLHADSAWVFSGTNSLLFRLWDYRCLACLILFFLSFEKGRDLQKIYISQGLLNTREISFKDYFSTITKFEKLNFRVLVELAFLMSAKKKFRHVVQFQNVFSTLFDLLQLKKI